MIESNTEAPPLLCVSLYYSQLFVVLGTAGKCGDHASGISIHHYTPGKYSALIMFQRHIYSLDNRLNWVPVQTAGPIRHRSISFVPESQSFRGCIGSYTYIHSPGKTFGDNMKIVVDTRIKHNVKCKLYFRERAVPVPPSIPSDQLTELSCHTVKHDKI